MSAQTPPRKNGPWTVLSEDCVYENPWLRVTHSAVKRPDGGDGAYGVVHFKNRAIGVLAIDEDGRVPLIGQHRFPLEAYSWELPEGGGPLAEDPLRSAQRELAEETGFTAATWTPLIGFDVSNSVTDEEAVCFIASDLTPGAPSPDPTEALTLRAAPFAELFDRVMSGDIRDALTIVMTLAAVEKARRGALPPALCTLILRDMR